MNTSNDTGTGDEGAGGLQSSASSTTRHEASTETTLEESETRKEEDREEKEETEETASAGTATETLEESEIRKEEKREEKEETAETDDLKKKSASDTATETPEEREKRKEEQLDEEKEIKGEGNIETIENEEKDQNSVTEPATSTSTPDIEEGGSSHDHTTPSSTDAPTRERRLSLDFSEEISATAPSSPATSDSPRAKRERGIDGSGYTDPSSAREDQESDSEEREISTIEVSSSASVSAELNSEPGALRLPGISDTSRMETHDDSSETVPLAAAAVSEITSLPSAEVSEVHQPPEDFQGGFLVEANLFTEPDVVVGEIVEEPQPVEEKGCWGRRKVRRAFILFLLVIGVVVGVGVSVGVANNGGASSESPNFDCSDASGCLYTGRRDFGFQDPASLLVGKCTDTTFDIPTSDNCDCEVNIPTDTPEGFESCQSCSFLESAGVGWQIAYDCSNILVGDCVGRDTSSNCISRKGFGTTIELQSAVDDYLADNSVGTLVARTYGWPIGVWDVSKIQDFSYLFAAGGPERFNPAAASFNEDITRWDVSSATSMESMFVGASAFNQPIGAWDVSSATDMNGMLGLATSFNQPIGAWDVSSVQTTGQMFYAAISFDQPLADWDVSSVINFNLMFKAATSFNQPIGNWERSSTADLFDMFSGSECPFVMEQQTCFYF
jgi:hypothetical protein